MPVRKQFLLCMAFIFSACGGDDTASQTESDSGVDSTKDASTGELDAGENTETKAPLYQTDGSIIRDNAGRAIILRGVNVAVGDLEQWEKEKTGSAKEVFQNVASSGFNAVRLVINWDRVEPNKDEIQTDYLDTVEQYVKIAADGGLYILVDMHQDLYGIGFNLHGAPYWTCDEKYYQSYEPTEPWLLNYYSDEVKACFDQFWTTKELQSHQQTAAQKVAERIADVKLVIGFDPFNEPFQGSISQAIFDRHYLKPFYEKFAKTVGKVLPGRLFFFEPPVIFILGCKNSMQGPLKSFKGVFAPHYYNTSVETDKLWDGKTELVTDAVACMVGISEKLDVPLALGELGGAMETPNLTEYLMTLYDTLDAKMAGSFIWIYSKGAAGFGLIDATTGEWNSHWMAYLRPAPSLINGDPISFNWNYDERKLHFSWSEKGKENTEIILPEWVKTAGYKCVLDGADFEPELNTAGNRLIIPPKEGGDRTFELIVNNN